MPKLWGRVLPPLLPPLSLTGDLSPSEPHVSQRDNNAHDLLIILKPDFISRPPPPALRCRAVPGGRGVEGYINYFFRVHVALVETTTERFRAETRSTSLLIKPTQ